MARILYMLGAGFSAPLRLPLVRDFFERSHLQHDLDPAKYGYFEEVFALVRELARAKNYYRTDLFDIEEILSLVDVRSRLSGQLQGELLQRYIRDVIEYHTPPIRPATEHSSVLAQAFGEDPWTGHIAMVAALLGVAVKRVRDAADQRFIWRHVAEEAVAHEYAVVSLNYDLVLEHGAAFLSQAASRPWAFIRSDSSGAITGFGGHLAKLHGSVDGGPIVPPTWSKSLENQRIASEWEHAARLLREAQQIRVIGYSLPPADSYVKYLLRAAAIDVKYLSRFDVVTKDDTQEVIPRYRTFVDHPRFRAEARSTEEYLGALRSAHQEAEQAFNPGALEKAHRRMFREPEA